MWKGSPSLESLRKSHDTTRTFIKRQFLPHAGGIKGTIFSHSLSSELDENMRPCAGGKQKMILSQRVARRLHTARHHGAGGGIWAHASEGWSSLLSPVGSPPLSESPSLLSLSESPVHMDKMGALALMVSDAPDSL